MHSKTGASFIPPGNPAGGVWSCPIWRHANWAQREELNCPKSHNFLEIKKGFKFSLSDSKLHSSVKPWVTRDVNRLDLWGILTPPSAWMVEPGAAYAQRPAGTCRDSASTPFVSTHVCSPNPAPGLSHIFRHLIRAQLLSAAWSLALAELSTPHVGFQPGRCSGHSSLSCSNSVEPLGTPSISEVTHLGYLSIKARPGPACHIGSWWGGEESMWGWTVLGVRSRDEVSAGDI